MPIPPEIHYVARASREHPRHGGADMVELADGSIFMLKMLIHESNLDQGAGDDAPSDLATLRSTDSGRTWSDSTVFLQPGPDETAAYTPGLLRLQDGRILLRYEMYHKFVVNEPFPISSYACLSSDECTTFSEPVAIWRRSSNLCG